MTLRPVCDHCAALPEAQRLLCINCDGQGQIPDDCDLVADLIFRWRGGAGMRITAQRAAVDGEGKETSDER